MKVAHLLLAASLAANAALLGWIVHERQAARAVPVSAPKPPLAAKTKSAGDALTLAQLQAALATGDAAALTAAGCSPEAIRSLAIGRAFDLFQSRMRAVRLRPAGGKYWQRGNLDGSQPSREARINARKAEHDFSDAVRDAFGEDIESIFNDRDSPYAFLSPDKLHKLQQIERDYRDMELQISADQEGITLPSDGEKLSLLQKEKERDIDAMLTPEERKQIELRESDTANKIRSRYGDAIETEEAYRKIFALQKAFDDERKAKLAGYAGGQVPADVTQWARDAENKLAEDIKATISPEQWARAQRANDQDYRTLTSLAQRLSLPDNAMAVVFAARDSYAAQSMAINADVSLSAQQRKAQLQELAKQAQTALAATLTPDGAQAFAQRAAWMNFLKNGQAYSTNPKDTPNGRIGLGTSVYVIPPPKQASSPSGS